MGGGQSPSQAPAKPHALPGQGPLQPPARVRGAAVAVHSPGPQHASHGAGPRAGNDWPKVTRPLQDHSFLARPRGEDAQPLSPEATPAGWLLERPAKATLLSKLPRAEQSESGRKHECKQRLPLGCGEPSSSTQHHRGQRAQAACTHRPAPLGRKPVGLRAAPCPGSCLEVGRHRDTSWRPSRHASCLHPALASQQGLLRDRLWSPSHPRLFRRELGGEQPV